MRTTKDAIGDKKIAQRTLTAFPGIKDFYNLLYDRIYMVLEQFFLDKPFTIIINALPRNHETGTYKIIERYGGFELCYAGIEAQKYFTELNLEWQKKLALKPYWDYLDKVIIRTHGDQTIYPDSDDLTVEYAQATSELYEKLRDGKLDIQQISFGNLADYFANAHNMELKITQCEFAVLSAFFKIEQYIFCTLPLIQFGEVDGVFHILFHKEETSHLYVQQEDLTWKPRKTMGNIIKAISREYEGLMLDWEVEGENFDFKRKAYARVVEADFDKDLYARLSENTILRELDYKGYYERHKPYFDGRFRRAQAIPELLNQPYRQTATLSIIIDSYTHNITAHSLTALEWWFRQRWLLDNPDPQKGQTEIQPKKADGLLVHEIHTMIRYLQDKGAFWTGLTRERSFGGKVSSLYSMLWYGFARNSLLFGTIAFSENILRVNIKVSIVKTIENTEGICFKKQKICSGHFASIDLREFYDSVKQKQDKHLEPLVKTGKDFGILREKLKTLKAYFPSSVVGQHAFNTILENEMRNVKHYGPEALEEMRKNGLTLHISIEEQSLNPGETDKEGEYLLIGVWLEHETMMSKEKIIDRLQRINGDILDPKTSRALLGGTYQDKICAAYLFNSTFFSVQKQDTDRDKRFYPWIKLGTTFIGEDHPETYEEVVISARRYFSDKHPKSKALFEEKFVNLRLGYFKKFLHLWKGADVYTVENPENIGSDWENPVRFRFVNISPDAPSDMRRKVREEGIIRIIQSNTAITLADAYRIWLKEWLYPYNHYQIQFYTHDSLSAVLEYKNEQISFYNKAERKSKNIEILPRGENVQIIGLIHGGEGGKKSDEQQLVEYRSHGVFKQFFLKYDKLHESKLEETVAAELLEFLATKVLLFDNRIAERLEHIDQTVLNDQLRCESFREEVKDWEKQKKLGFERFNIIVLHLSFIETFFDVQKRKRYSEEDIKKFLDDEILSNSKVRAKRNFLLVITTGRGRTQWWEKLKENKTEDYTSSVTFRPVEAILSTIEDAFSIQDDIELKYRLIKVLFGS